MLNNKVLIIEDSLILRNIICNFLEEEGYDVHLAKDGKEGGVILILADILSIVNPVAFSRVASIRQYVKEIAEDLKLPDPWQFEIAGLLSQIGCVALPPEVLKKVNANLTLTVEENKMFASHPSR